MKVDKMRNLREDGMYDACKNECNNPGSIKCRYGQPTEPKDPDEPDYIFPDCNYLDNVIECPVYEYDPPINESAHKVKQTARRKKHP
jgi:hypothetical protein